MGRVSDQIEFAEVSFLVMFSQQEVAENLLFGLYIPLFEIDDELDTYHWEPNGAFSVSAHWRSIGDLDDFVTWVATDTVRPNGQSSRFFTYRSEFDVKDQESGEEEYKALVWVVPEIVEGKSWTNTLRVNLG
jgi:hypothetical protein